MARCLDPVASSDARVLVLGSIPGEVSIAQQRYYAHPRNAFWPLMESLLGDGTPLEYPDRLELVKRSGVAIWDVLASAERQGSLDSAIDSGSEVPNDIPGFVRTHPGITHIFFNGAKAEASFRRHVGDDALPEGLKLTRLPSTSPANAAMSLHDKRLAWRAAADAARVNVREDGGREYTAYRSAELAEVYDVVYANVEDVPFWLDIARHAGLGSLLELGCGTGRLLLPLARAGHTVTGIDVSQEMLARCRDKLSHEPPEVRARVTMAVADMTSFSLGERFALVFCAFGSFHHLHTVEQQLQCLRRCREHLLPGGALVLDLINPDPVVATAEDDAPAQGDLSSTVVVPADARRIRSWATVLECHRAVQVNDCRITHEITEADGSVRQLTETFPMRFLFRFELEHLLARCGFRVVALYGDYDGSVYGDASLGMIVVAETTDE